MPMSAAIFASSRILSQANICAYQRRPELFFSLGGNYTKICSPEEMCCKATGRVPGSWLFYNPQGMAKADTEHHSRDWGSEQRLCHNTYFFKCSDILRENWKDIWIRNFTQPSLKQKFWGEEEDSNLFLSLTPCKDSDTSAPQNKTITYNTQY